MVVTDSITIEYLQLHDQYRKKYGDKCFIMMQVGSFFEGYSTKTRGPNLQQIANMLNIICTRKDKSVNDISEKNPYMMGFPIISVHKFISLLVNNGYTIVLVEQVTPPPKPQRKVTNIYSPGTYIDQIESNATNAVISIYITEEKQRNNTKLICAGLSAIDLSTGKSWIHEALSSESDNRYAYDEINRFINAITPREVVIFIDADNKDNRILQNLEIENLNYIIKQPSQIPKYYYEIRFQNEFFGKIYKTDSILSPIEILDLDRKSYARMSLIILLDFAKEHQENVLNGIQQPIEYLDCTHMVLGNDAIHQLNVISNGMDDKYIKYNSLFNVVNNTSTAMGFRLLKDKLVSPIINHDDLEKCYSYIDTFIKTKLYIDLEESLALISDIERLARKMVLARISPYEMANLYESLIESIKIHDRVKKIIPSPSDTTINNIKLFLQQIDKTFSLNEMKKYSINTITNTFFNHGIHKDLDKLYDQMRSGIEFMDELCSIMEEYMGENKKDIKRITVKKNDRDGFYLSLSKSRAEMLKINLEAVESITVKGKLIKIEDLQYDYSNKNAVKITVKDLNLAETNEDNEKIIAKISELTTKYYIETVKKLNDQFEKDINEIVPFIAHVDLIKSNAKTATKYNYIRPTIKYDETKSFVNCVDLRHPIIERLIDHEYIPQSLDLGRDLKGILLMGINSSGKSVLMKSLGLSIIMAQAGMYVAARDFVFSPYRDMFTRITGNDNLFKGLSSFAVEMIELKNIMKRANPFTLVIGDEVCRGTEHISGNAIVASTIINLSKSNATFIFATHLHEIANMERIKVLKNVQPFHISVEYDTKTNALVYDRRLKPGSGEAIYGITVAKHIIQDKEFIDLANEIKNELLGTYDGISSGIKSRYNSNLLLDECKLCGMKNKKMHISPLETHHIQQQKDAIDGFCGDKPHLPKNSIANLVVLCSECHDKLHRGEYKIDGYYQTSIGKALKVNKKNGPILIKN